MVRKRGSLREALKHEKEQNKTFETVYDFDPLLDFELCVEKLEKVRESLSGSTQPPPRGRSILLHLGMKMNRLLNRLEDTQQTVIKDMLDREIELLNTYYYQKKINA